ncbi:MAG: ATP phosphoribosyltransferase [Candidatus Omnitrophica bacterium]|jgi:ATP phosphoribosyltransferase|nr:ATP phosphoribosyltransferase [Candidatus Omnitrophota bacterium]
MAIKSSAASNLKLKFGLPKGSLQDSTFKMLQKAGFQVSVSSRSYFPYIDDAELDPVLIRAQEMSRYVEQGALDCGITGEDWILENHSDVVRVAELMYAKTGRNRVRWVLAVPNQSNIHKPEDLKGKRIATELKGFTEQFFKERRIPVDVEFSWGATEVKVGYGLVDAIVDITETGSSLKANNLRIVETLCYSTTKFIANKAAWKDPVKRRKIEGMAMLFLGAIGAEGKVGLKMNVAQKNLKKVLGILPALKKPTISHLSDKGWLVADTILDESVVKHLIPRLKEAGAQGIIEYPLNKVID